MVPSKIAITPVLRRKVPMINYQLAVVTYTCMYVKEQADAFKPTMVMYQVPESKYKIYI